MLNFKKYNQSIGQIAKGFLLIGFLIVFTVQVKFSETYNSQAAGIEVKPCSDLYGSNIVTTQTQSCSYRCDWDPEETGGPNGYFVKRCESDSDGDGCPEYYEEEWVEDDNINTDCEIRESPVKE